MKLFSLFSRPAWESADVDKRAIAVATEDDPSLLARLPDVARHDADAKVRLAAVKRIDDLSLLGDRARLDLSADVRDAAGARLRQLLLDPKVALDARLRIVRVMDNTVLLELIATEGLETDLRACALERIRRVGFLAERCVKDPDPQLRLTLLDRIDELVQLERIAERARKTDKQLSRLARERVLAAKLAVGDVVAIDTRAQELCAALDALLRARSEGAETRLAQIEADWSRLPIAEDAPLARRYRGLADTLRHLLNPPPKPAPEPEPTPIAAPEPMSAATAAVATAEPDAAAEAEKTDAAAVREAEQARRRQWHERVQAAIAALARALDAGQFTEARSARAELQRIEGEWPKSNWDEARRFAELEASYAQLERWQQWSLRDQKKRICDAAEALGGSGLHPDALLTRVRELQAEWERLVAGDATEASDGLARRFRALIHLALAPARPYLEKRKELRGEKGRAVATLLDSAETALADEALALPALLEWRGKLNEAGAQVAELVGSDRRDAGARRKQLADTLQTRIDALNDAAAEAKRKLIAQLRRQLASVDAHTQVQIAKSAMPQWKALPRAQRKTEDALWNELRTLIDPVFETDRAAHDRQRSEREEQRRAVAEALAALESLVDADFGADALRHQANELHQRFQTLERGRDDDLAFDRAMAKIERRMAMLRSGQAEQLRQRTLSQSARLAALEQRIADGDTSTAVAAELDTLQTESPASELAHRISVARAALSDSEYRKALACALGDHDVAAEFALRAELAAGLPSPDEWRERRRALQLARLASKLSGGIESEEGAEMLWRGWIAMAGTGLPSRAPIDARILAALAHGTRS